MYDGLCLWTKFAKDMYVAHYVVPELLFLLASYASNEICLNWNAPLVYMTGMLALSGEQQQKP